MLRSRRAYVALRAAEPDGADRSGGRPSPLLARRATDPTGTAVRSEWRPPTRTTVHILRRSLRNTFAPRLRSVQEKYLPLAK